MRMIGLKGDKIKCEKCGYTWKPKIIKRMLETNHKSIAILKGNKITCGNCGYTWIPKVKQPKSCVKCHVYFMEYKTGKLD